MPIKPDIDPQETQEWLEALEAVLENEGVDRAHFLIERMVDKARRSGAYLPFSANTTMAMAFQRMKERMRRSMALSPGNRFCWVTGMVFT